MKTLKIRAYNSKDVWQQTIEVKENTFENVIGNVVCNFFLYHKTMKKIGVKVFKSSEPILLRFEAENVNVDLGLLDFEVQSKFKLQNNYESRVRFHANLLETTSFIIQMSEMKPVKTKDVAERIKSLG
jgi:hypothetical protein